MASDGRASKTLILIHGWCGDQTFWRDQIEAFGDDFDIVALDLAGDDASMAGLAQNVVAIAARMGDRPIGLIGHSMGGPVAIEAAIRLGDRCRFVIGVDTFTDAAFYRRQSKDITARRIQTFEMAFGATMETMVRAITAPRTDPAVVDWIIGKMSRADRAIALPRLAALLDWEIEERWPLLTCPVETINSAFLDRGLDRIALPDLGLHLMEDAGHFPMLERPKTFNALALTIANRLWP